jgi:DNA-directed RNA polymerase specialized sigma subunit
VQPLSPHQQNLFDEHLNWAVNITRNIVRKMPTAFDPEDLIQAGRIGLWKAVQKFNPKRGIPFQGCARVRWLAKGDAVGQAHFIAELFGLAA